MKPNARRLCCGPDRDFLGKTGQHGCNGSHRHAVSEHHQQELLAEGRHAPVQDLVLLERDILSRGIGVDQRVAVVAVILPRILARVRMPDCHDCVWKLLQCIVQPLRHADAERLQSHLPVRAFQAGFQDSYVPQGLADSGFLRLREGRDAVALHDANGWFVEDAGSHVDQVDVVSRGKAGAAQDGAHLLQ